MQSSTERGPGSVARRNEPYKPNPFCLRLPRGLRGWTSLIYKIPVKSQNPGFAQKEIPPYNQSTQAGSKP